MILYLQKIDFRRSPNIDPEIVRTMKIQGPIGYAPNPKTIKRNQVTETNLLSLFYDNFKKKKF